MSLNLLQTTEAYEKFKTLKDEAIKELLELRKSLVKKLEQEITLLNEKFDTDADAIGSKLAELGHKLARGKNAAVSSVRRRQKFIKVSDDEIKAKLSELLQGGKKVKSSEIFGYLGIARSRFTQFLKVTPDFIATEGNKRSTIYFLK